MTTLYGIKNCDTVKKARRWLDNNAIEYTFHDIRVNGLDAAIVELWQKQVGKDQLINKRSTTWKQLSDGDKALFDGDSLDTQAIELVLSQPTLIKRPVIDQDGQVLVGFKEAQYNELF